MTSTSASVYGWQDAETWGTEGGTSNREALGRQHFRRALQWQLGYLLKSLRSPLHCVRQSALQKMLDCLTRASEASEDRHAALEQVMQEGGRGMIEAMMSVMSLDQEASESYANRMTSSTSSEVSLAAQILQGCCLYSKHDPTPPGAAAVSKVLLNEIVKGAGGSASCCQALTTFVLHSAAELTFLLRQGGIQQLCESVRRPRQGSEARQAGLEVILLTARHLCDTSLKDNGANLTVLLKAVFEDLGEHARSSVQAFATGNAFDEGAVTAAANSLAHALEMKPAMKGMKSSKPR